MNTTIPEIELVKLFMHGVDVVTAARRQGGTEAYLELLDLFYTDGQKRFGLLQNLIAEQDSHRYQIEVHGLKSAAANIGANNLSEWAKKHEHAAKDYDFVEENAGALFGSYQAVLDEIKRVLRARNYGQFARRDEATLESIEDAELTARVGEALAHLEDFESHEAADAVTTLLGCRISDEVREKLEHVQGLLKLYEDDQAEDELRALLEYLGQDAPGH